MYFFNSIELFKMVLLSNAFYTKVYYNIAYYIDNLTKLYYSYTQAASIKAYLREYTRSSLGEVIFPLDYMYYKCHTLYPNCRGNKKHIGRVIAIGKDFTSTAIQLGSVRFTIIPLMPFRIFNIPRSEYPLANGTNAEELWLSERDVRYVGTAQVFRQVTDIHFDYRYKGHQTQRRLARYSARYVVRNIWDRKTSSTRALQLSAPIRGELEIATHSRAQLLRFSEGPCISLPLLTFIDAFGLYRNMYRSILGIYVTIAGLNWRERKRRTNVLPLALGPHASKFKDVIKVLEPKMKSLNQGLVVNINSVQTWLCVFIMAFVRDIKQQQENSRFRSPLANYRYKKYLVTKTQKADFTFNIVINT